MRIYEEYETQADKRKAQVGAKRGKITSKATGYLLVFDEDGLDQNTGCYSALGSLVEGGRAIVFCNPSPDYLRGHCRRVGFSGIPDEWKQVFAVKLDDCLDESVPELKKQRKRYRQVLKHL